MYIRNILIVLSCVIPIPPSPHWGIHRCQGPAVRRSSSAPGRGREAVQAIGD